MTGDLFQGGRPMQQKTMVGGRLKNIEIHGLSVPLVGAAVGARTVRAPLPCAAVGAWTARAPLPGTAVGAHCTVFH